MKLIDFINEEQSALLKPTSSYMKGVNDYIKKNPGKSHEDFKLLTPNKQNKYLDKYVDEAGCLGKQIKKGKKKTNEKFKPHTMYHPKTGKAIKADKEEDHLRLAKKGYVHSKDEIEESTLNEYKYYTVKGPKGFKERIVASSESDAKTKARHLAYRQGKATVGSSRFSGTSNSDFEIDEGKSSDMQNMFNELRIDDNTYISDGNKELTPAEVGSGFYLLGYDRDGSCFEMSKISKERAKDIITGHGEYKVADADITDFNDARYYYNENMPDSGILNIKSSFEEGKSPHKKGTKKYKKHMAAMHAESIQLEDVDLSDNMIGTPDEFYDEEERKDAFKDLKDAMDDCSKDYETEGVIDGVCPNCAGSGYQDAEYEVWDDDEDDYVEGNECDGWGNYGCDEGEMENCSWIEIIKHDKRNAERQKAKADYPGDEAVIDQISRAVKQMDDPRQMFQYMQADYPFMGRAQRSSLIAQGMKKAGLTSESLNEGEERSIIHDATVEKLVDEFSDRVGEMESMEELHDKLYMELEYLDVDEVVDPDMEVGGQRIGDFANGRVIDVVSSEGVMDEVTNSLDLSDLEDRDPAFPYQYKEGTIDQTFATDNIDKHDKKSKPKKDDKQKLELEVLKKLSGIKVDENLKDLERLDLQGYKGLDGRIYSFYPNEGPRQPYPDSDLESPTGKHIGMFRADDGTEALPPIVNPKQPSDFKQGTKIGNDLMKQRIKARNKTAPGNPRAQKQKPGFFGSLFNDIHEDSEGDSNEAEIAKIIAKALGDSNRWTEMSAQELYAELESIKPDLADTIKDIGRMIYGVRLAENKTKFHDSSECGCDCGKPVCAACGRPHHPNDIKEVTLEDNQDFHEEFGVLGYSIDKNDVFEAEYRGRKVKLNKPTRGDVKKFKVYVKDPKTGNVKKVNFGHGGTSAKRKTMRIRKSNPKARKSFRARHNCDNPGPKTKARYWSCRKW